MNNCRRLVSSQLSCRRLNQTLCAHCRPSLRLHTKSASKRRASGGTADLVSIWIRSNVANFVFTQRARQIHAKLFSKISTYASMHCALSVQKPLLILSWKDAFVPNASMNIHSPSSITPEGDDFIWAEIVARKRQRHNKRLVIEGEEKLSTVRVIIHMPK
jgi:hypothetical protein